MTRLPPDLARYAAAQPREAHVVDPGIARLCRKCGYDLRGQARGGVCPECGFEDTYTDPRTMAEPLSEAPEHVIRTFAFGAMMCALIAGLFVAFTISRPLTPWRPITIPVVHLVLAIAWIVGVRLATPAFDIPQAVLRGFGPSSRLRTAAWLTQFVWLVPAATDLGFTMARPAAGPTRDLLAWTVQLGTLGGIAAAICLAVLLERLAEWTRDDLAQRALQWTIWLLPVMTILLWLDFRFLPVRLAVYAGWLLAAGAFPVALWSLAQTTVQSIHHHHEYLERETRRIQRARTFDDELADRARHTQSTIPRTRRQP
jgi:heme exporter protein D